MGGLILSLDFGGTKLSAGVFERGADAWRTVKRVPSDPDADRRWDLNAMTSLACDLLTGAKPLAVGVSFGGLVNVEEGRVLLSHHVAGWEDFPLRAQLAKRFDAPVAIENDANIAALAEWRFGAGRDCGSLLYITVSTGIGGGWILDGGIHRGADGLAGEIGHMTVQPRGPVCTCQRRGCLEAVAAGPAIAQRAREHLTAKPEQGTKLRRLVADDLEAVTAQHVSRAASAGDMLAQQVLNQAARWLGLAIGCAIVLVNPERVVVGGGVSKSGGAYFESIRAAAREHVLPGMRVDIVPTALGDDAPLWGGIALAEQLLS